MSSTATSEFHELVSELHSRAHRCVAVCLHDRLSSLAWRSLKLPNSSLGLGVSSAYHLLWTGRLALWRSRLGCSSFFTSVTSELLHRKPWLSTWKLDSSLPATDLEAWSPAGLHPQVSKIGIGEANSPVGPLPRETKARAALMHTTI